MFKHLTVTIKFWELPAVLCLLLFTVPCLGQAEKSCGKIYTQSQPEAGLPLKAQIFMAQQDQYVVDLKRIPWDVSRQLAQYSKIYSLNENLFMPQFILKFIYQTYSLRRTVPENSIAAMRELDDSIDAEHTSYIVYSEPDNNRPQVAIRFFDASPETRLQKSKTLAKIPMEIEYPNLVLPDRAAGNNNLIELGRLGKAKNVRGDITQLLSSARLLLIGYHYEVVGKKIRRKGVEPVIYIEASAVGARLYKTIGFTQVFGPREVGAEDTYILHMRGDVFIEKFAHLRTDGFFLSPAVP